MEYSVRIPLLASVTVSIEAESEKEAIEKAIGEYCDIHLKVESKVGYELEEWNVFDKITEGNFYYGHINEADAEPNDWANI